MIDIHFERHLMSNPTLPFIFHTDFVSKKRNEYANWHDNTEFLYCLEGHGYVHCDNTELLMTKGDIIIINARCLHKIDSPESVKYYCLIIDNSFFKDNGIDIEKIRFKERFNDTLAAEYIEKAVSCFKQSDGKFSIAQKRLNVLNFVYYICCNYSQELSTKSTTFTKSYTAVLDAIEYINKNFRQRLSLDEISSNAGFSRYHFSRIFKENTGQTIIEHINTKRCEYAGILLRDTSFTVSEISFECGFDNPSYFAKTFKNIYGLLPSEYRQKHSKI